MRIAVIVVSAVLIGAVAYQFARWVLVRWMQGGRMR